jgi:ethanolamine utilization protein EutN
MQIARVHGRATTTVRHKSLAGAKLLICQPLGADGQGSEDPVLALDRLGAGVGDRVIISSDGDGLRALLGDPTSPARWWTLGIVDELA